MSNRKYNTAKLLTLAITITLLGGLPLMAQDAQVAELLDDDRLISDVDPRLMSSRPLMGKEVTLAATSLSPDGSAWFFFSPAPDNFVPIDKNRTIYFDLNNYVSVGAYTVDSDGFVGVSTTLPDIPQLVGVEISVQLASVSPRDELELTNGLLWTLGSTPRTDTRSLLRKTALVGDKPTSAVCIPLLRVLKKATAWSLAVHATT